MATPSPGYAITVRVEAPSSSGATSGLVAAVSTANGALTALDVVESHADRLVVDVTCNASDAEHADAIVEALAQVPGVTVRKVSDRTFLMHLGGKLEVNPRVPLKNRDDLSRAYTPGVARVCLAIAKNPEDVRRLTIKRNTVAVVTDGSAVLGLGNIGPAAALPVMEGKAALFKQFAGVSAWPVCLDTQDTEEIIRTVKLIAPVYGGINLEDIAAPRCFEIERRLRDELDIPVFHDDQHGTAIVVLAALTNALKVVGKRIEDVRVVISGVGAAGHAIITLLHAQGVGDIVACDRHGALHPGQEHQEPARRWIAQNTNADGRTGTLSEVLAGADVFIGVSAPRLLTGEDVAAMAPDAIVFALANPDPEVDPLEAGRTAAVVATGRSDFPNQINNVLAFPGFFRGMLDAGAREITQEVMLAAARAIAGCVHEENLNASYIVPSVFDPAVAPAVAHAVREAATRQGNASPAAAEADAQADETVPAYQPQAVMEGATSAPESRVEVTGTPVDGQDQILTPEALGFLADLQRTFGARRDELLAARRTRRDEVSRTGRLDFLPETAPVRDGDWRVAAAPDDLVDRRVEMTGPTDRKMTINALNSGARVWLADMEDASTPHWHNVIGGQVNLCDAIRRTITFTNEKGKEYALRTDQRLATIVVRPRGWHFDERHLLVDGTPVVGALVDFGLYFFHNAQELLDRGSGPYFYLPKTESHLEARLWNDVFTHAEERLGVPYGTVRATVLIETIPAAFEMDEILYELRDHASGLNAGRWDYLFSIIKYFRDSGPEFVLPDRATIGMPTPFMRAYAELLVKTCHRRGAFAIGGMSAFIPSRKDKEANERAFAKVREDKQREAGQGFDGSWVAHPDLVPVCQEVFDGVLGDRPNQLDVLRDDVHVTAEDLLDIASAEGQITRAGLEGNVEIAARYLEAWLGGLGAVGIHNLMEDAATAEISRSQIWQWVHNASRLDDGTLITAELVRDVMEQEHGKIRAELGGGYDDRNFETAFRVLEQVALADDYVDFLTLPAYEAAAG